MPLGTRETLERANHRPQCPRSRSWPGRGERGPGWPGEMGSRWLPGRGGMWSPSQLLPIKQSWHFSTRQRRWLPALEVSVWPQSQRSLPSPGLSPQRPDRGPQQAHCHPTQLLNGAIQGLCDRPLWRALPPPLQGALSRSPGLCGWGSGCGESSRQPGQQH